MWPPAGNGRSTTSPERNRSPTDWLGPFVPIIRLTSPPRDGLLPLRPANVLEGHRATDHPIAADHARAAPLVLAGDRPGRLHRLGVLGGRQDPEALRRPLGHPGEHHQAARWG